MKYYTPKIEEFRIGFECEVLIKDTWEKGICKVVSNEMSEGCIEQLEVAYTWVREDGKVFEYSINPYEVDSRWVREFRVKYLDKEDIKSLGWEEQYGKYVIDKSTDFPNERIIFTLLFNGSTNIEIFKTSLTSYGNHNEKMQFKINNKSEFRKLMYQLNVL